MSKLSAKLPPLVITVAPTGAYRTAIDSPNIPITPQQLSITAQSCLEAGAAMIHLHVRDARGKHSLSASYYRLAIDAIRKQVSDKLVIQVSTESAGVFTLAQQIQLVRELQPESASIALRELLQDKKQFADVRKFFKWLSGSAVLPQIILYDHADIRRYQQLINRGIIGTDKWPVLFVLGTSKPDGFAVADDLQGFLQAYCCSGPWSVCAFGPHENECALAAAACGGHVRIGFENNILLQNGDIAADNAALISQLVLTMQPLGRSPATADQLRELWAV